MLACGHAFCLECIQELVQDHPLPHQLKDIKCPIHKQLQSFSPRLLPRQSGCRILSLDGGGVKGLAQLIMLKHIEQRCFKIPLIHLFDLVVGTSIGGQIALALTTGIRSGPITVSAATEEFRKLMNGSFIRKFPGSSLVSFITGRTTYKASKLQNLLQNLFGKERKLFNATPVLQSGLPNIAVTTVVEESFEAHLVTN